MANPLRSLINKQNKLATYNTNHECEINIENFKLFI